MCEFAYIHNKTKCLVIGCFNIYFTISLEDDLNRRNFRELVIGKSVLYMQIFSIKSNVNTAMQHPTTFTTFWEFFL